MPANQPIKDVDDVRSAVGADKILALLDKNVISVGEKSEISELTSSSDPLLSPTSLNSPVPSGGIEDEYPPPLPSAALYGLSGEIYG